MNGGVSHMERFDPKPMFTRNAGKTNAETLFVHTQDLKRLATEQLRFSEFRSVGQLRPRIIERQPSPIHFAWKP